MSVENDEKQPQRGCLCCIPSLQGLGNILEKGQKDRKNQRLVGEWKGDWRKVMDMTEPLHSWSHSSCCLHTACQHPASTHPCIEGSGDHKPAPLPESYWRWMASGGGSQLSLGVGAPFRSKDVQCAHPWVYGKQKLDSMSYLGGKKAYHTYKAPIPQKCS